MIQRFSFYLTIISLSFHFVFISIPNALAENEILAKVGDVSLTQEKFSLMVQAMPPQYQAMVENMPKVKDDLVRSWTETTLLSQEALNAGIDKDPLIALRLEEMTIRILVEKLISERIDTTTPIPADEVRQYYDTHPDEFIQGEQVKAQHILIRIDKNSSPEAQAKAQALIVTIQKRLEAGESFMKLAEEFSEDPGSKDKGGDLGYFGKGQMIAEFEEAAFNAQIGQICEPVKTPYGFHLIKVNDKKEAVTIPFDHISQKLEEKLRTERNHKALQDLLAVLKEKYPVTIY